MPRAKSYALPSPGGRPPLLATAVVLGAFRDEFQLASPPPAVQRLLFGCLAPLGRLLGHRVSPPDGG